MSGMHLRGAGCVFANMRPRAATDPPHAAAKFVAVEGSSRPQKPPEKSLLEAPLREAIKAACDTRLRSDDWAADEQCACFVF
eukprot:1159076-Pelagomonas_calceolata.AAC.3